MRLLPSTPERRYGAFLGAASAGWAILALLVVPSVIRSAYAERSLPVLNRILAGRSVHPVEFYLDTWWGVAGKLSMGLAVAGALGYAAVRYRRAIRSAFRSEGWTPVTVASAVVVAAWLGWWTGLIDIGYRLADVALNGRTKGAGIEDLWMAPVLGAGVAAGLGWMSWRVTRRANGQATLHGAATAGLAFLFYSWLRLFGLGIHPLAAVVLAVGVGSQLSRPLVTWGPGFVRFTKRTLPWMAVATVVTAVVLGAREPLAERRATQGLEPAAGAKSVLLLILDTARARSMSLYGHHRATTPNIDRLASRGATFNWAFAPSPWTLPSHATFFTGLGPEVHRANWGTRLGKEFTTLAEVLGAEGYATGGFVANMEFTLRTTGLDQGFHRYRDDSMSIGRFIGSLGFVREPVLWVRRVLGRRAGLVRKHADGVNDEFLDWLDGQVPDGAPYFGFLNYFDVHAGYEPQHPFDTLFSPPDERYWIDEEWNDATLMTPAEVTELENSYDEAMAYLDSRIGALLEELGRRGRLENTLIVVTSDHGEQFGEHGLLAHANSLYVPVLHVPLVLVDPSGSVPPGARVDDSVSLAHLAATILDLVGVRSDFPGNSLARYWERDEPTEPMLTQVDNGYGRWTMRGSIEGKWNYVRNYGGSVPEELYDLAVDPLELRNLAQGPRPKETTDRLQWMRHLVDSLDTGPPPDPSEAPVIRP